MKANKQTNLFDNNESVKASSTNLVKLYNVEAEPGDDPSLRRLKHNFNHRLKAIAKLREKIENLPKVFALLNKQFDEIVMPSEESFITSKLALVETIDVAYQKKSFSENERDYMRSFMMDELNAISEMGYEYDDRFQKYFQLDKFDELEGSKEFMQQMINDMMGIDVDLEDMMGEEKLSDEEFEEKYGAEMREKAKAFEEEQKNHKQEQKKKQAKKDDEPNLNLHFMKTYKSLAKKIHPDLEQDVEIRKEKEKLMQELAHAKDNQDLFQLISIKLKVDKIENNEVFLDETYLKLYAQRLLEQKKDLETDIYIMKKQSGRNSWLYRNFHAPHLKTTKKRLERFRDDLIKDAEECKQLTKQIKTIQGMKKHIRAIREEEEGMFFEYW